MKISSNVRRLGFAVASVAAGAFVAHAALAEPPSHGFNLRNPRPDTEVVKQVHAPHPIHKAHPLLSPGTKGDHPTHKVVTRPPRVDSKQGPPPTHEHNTPERLVVVKRPNVQEILHQPHVSRSPPLVNRALPPHQPAKPPIRQVVPQVTEFKAKVTQQVIVVAPKHHE